MVTFVHAGFRVNNYEQWRKGFDASAPQRKMAGEVSYRVLRDVDDPDCLTVVSVLKNAALVTVFMKTPNFESMMKASGVVQMGRVSLLEEVDSGTQ